MLKKMLFAIAFQGSAMLFTLSSVAGLIVNPAEGFAQEGVLKIYVTDSINGEVISFAGVILESAGVMTAQGQTDIEGKLVFKNLAPGLYKVSTIFGGYPKNIISGVLVKNHETTELEVMMSSLMKTEFTLTEYKKPLINPIGSKKVTFDYEEIKLSPLSPMEMVNTQGVETKPGISPSFHGARQDANVIFIDGMRVIGSAALPRMGVQQVSVTLGGIPAQFGDGTGGFIEFETRSGLVNPNKR